MISVWVWANVWCLNCLFCPLLPEPCLDPLLFWTWEFVHKQVLWLVNQCISHCGHCGYSDIQTDIQVQGIVNAPKHCNRYCEALVNWWFQNCTSISRSSNSIMRAVAVCVFLHQEKLVLNEKKITLQRERQCKSSCKLPFINQHLIEEGDFFFQTPRTVRASFAKLARRKIVHQSEQRIVVAVCRFWPMRKPLFWKWEESSKIFSAQLDFLWIHKCSYYGQIRTMNLCTSVVILYATKFFIWFSINCFTILFWGQSKPNLWDFL